LAFFAFFALFLAMADLFFIGLPTYCRLSAKPTATDPIELTDRIFFREKNPTPKL